MIKKNKWWVFLGASLMLFLINLDITVVTLALATIAKDLHTSLVDIQWVLNSYLLSTMIFFIIGGKLSDIYGRKFIFLIGTFIFGISSLLIGTTSNFTFLIIGRFIQGIGFAFTISLALLMITSRFPARQRGLALGLAITLTGLGQALGPTIGGIILQELNWHWIFLLNVPFSIVSFCIIFFALKKDIAVKRGEKIDITGAILLGIALSLLLLTFDTLSGLRFNLKLFIVGLVISFCLLLIFYWKERRTRFPLIDFKLFGIRDYTLTTFIRFLFMYTYGNFLLFVPLYLQNILGYSPLISGLILLIYSALFGICSPLAGIWCDLVGGYKSPIFSACLFGLLSFILFALITVNTSIYLIAFGLLFYGICTGVMVLSSVNATISSLPVRSVGEGFGMFFTIAFLGTSLGVAISGAHMNLLNNFYLNANQHVLKLLNSSEIQLLHHVANGTRPISILNISGDATHFAILKHLATRSFIHGFSSIMSLNAVLAFIMLIVSIALKQRKKI